MSKPPDQSERDRIVRELDKTMLVEAAAGTGKTTAMISRLVALLRAGKCRIEAVAAVTFTRKAAAEAQSRFQLELERAAREATGKEADRLRQARDHVELCFIGTVHSFCARLLRERPVEAGVDPAFEELDEERDARLRERAWEMFGAELYTTDDPLLDELEELGLPLADLRAAFLQYADYPDVDEWPAPATPRPAVKPVVAQLNGYLARMRRINERVTEAGNDALLPLYRRVPAMARARDLDRPADVAEVLEQFREDVKVVQKQWPDGKEQALAEQQRFTDFTREAAQPFLDAWRAHRYPVVLRVLQQAGAVYDRQRAAARGLNFQDLLMRAARLLRERPEIRRYFRRRFSHLLVDEFQDTDPVQAEVMLLLTADDPSERDWRKCRPVPGSLFVVGDPMQSIYRFRRADIVTYNTVKDIILRHGGACVALTANFRSLEPIVDWVNTTFTGGRFFPATPNEFSPAYRQFQVGRTTPGYALNVRRIPLSGTDPAGESTPQPRGLPSQPGDPAAAGSSVVRGRETCAQLQDSQELVPPLGEAGVWKLAADATNQDELAAREAGIIARRIRAALDKHQAGPGDFLIMARQKARLSVYAAALAELGIPHEVTGGTSLNEVRELGLWHTVLTALVQPDNPVALLAALRSEVFGLSDQQLYAFRRAGGKFNHRAPLPPAAGHVFQEAWSCLNSCAQHLAHLSPVVAVERIASDLGLFAAAAAAAGGSTSAGSFCKALELLRRASAGLPTTADLVAQLGRLVEPAEEHDGLPVVAHAASAVRIMNLHKAKGLEAAVVFLADPSGESAHEVTLHIDRQRSRVAGYLAVRGEPDNWGRARWLAHPPGWADLAAREEQFQQAERHRLLYVAATRAGAQLVVSLRVKRAESNPWQPFADRLADAPTLADPGPPAGATVEPEVVRPAAVETALAAVQRRWDAALKPSYATRAAKPAMFPAPLAAAAREEAVGLRWGGVIHALLQLAMSAPRTDWAALAPGIVQEAQLDEALTEAALETVRQVTGSALWQRAGASRQRLTEVPFLIRQVEDDTLVRGVIDLAFEEPDGWVIVDYKTDRTTAKGVNQLVETYRPQLAAYQQAWSDILQRPVRETGLYFTHLNQYVRVAR